jgi:hypothetical protein
MTEALYHIGTILEAVFYLFLFGLILAIGAARSSN